MPLRATAGAAGIDLYADKAYRIYENCRMSVSTGIAVRLPAGTYGQIAPRSGLARDYGIIVLGGVIDSDYRGEIMIMLMNTGNRPMDINVGDRIAQLIALPYIAAPMMAVVSLDETGRGSRAFGSTGK